MKQRLSNLGLEIVVSTRSTGTENRIFKGGAMKKSFPNFPQIWIYENRNTFVLLLCEFRICIYYFGIQHCHTIIVWFYPKMVNLLYQYHIKSRVIKFHIQIYPLKIEIQFFLSLQGLSFSARKFYVPLLHPVPQFLPGTKC